MSDSDDDAPPDLLFPEVGKVFVAGDIGGLVHADDAEMLSPSKPTKKVPKKGVRISQSGESRRSSVGRPSRSDSRPSVKSPSRTGGRSPRRVSGQSPGRPAGKSPGRPAGKSPSRSGSRRTEARSSVASPGRPAGKSPSRSVGSRGRTKSASRSEAERDKRNKMPDLIVARSPSSSSGSSKRSSRPKGAPMQWLTRKTSTGGHSDATTAVSTITRLSEDSVPTPVLNDSAFARRSVAPADAQEEEEDEVARAKREWRLRQAPTHSRSGSRGGGAFSSRPPPAAAASEEEDEVSRTKRLWKEKKAREASGLGSDSSRDARHSSAVATSASTPTIAVPEDGFDADGHPIKPWKLRAQREAAATANATQGPQPPTPEPSSKSQQTTQAIAEPTKQPVKSISGALRTARASAFNMTDHGSHGYCGDGYEHAVFLEKIPGELYCGLCRKVSRWVVEVECGGGHCFCHCCILRYIEGRLEKKLLPDCPVHKSTLQVSQCRLGVKDQRRINNARVRCPHKGCGKEMSCVEFDEHAFINCQFRPERCTGCRKMVRVKDMSACISKDPEKHAVAAWLDIRAMRGQITTAQNDVEYRVEQVDELVREVPSYADSVSFMSQRNSSRMERLQHMYIACLLEDATKLEREQLSGVKQRLRDMRSAAPTEPPKVVKSSSVRSRGRSERG